MAALPEYKRLLREDFAEIEEEWIDKLIYPINQFNEQVTAALNQSLTIGDNVTGNYRSVTFTTSATYSTGTFTPITVQWGFRQAPQAVMIGRIYLPDSPTTIIKTAVSLDWIVGNNNSVTVRFIAGLSNSTKYTANLLLL